MRLIDLWQPLALVKAEGDGKKRKNQPGYIRKINRIGHTYWAHIDEQERESVPGTVVNIGRAYRPEVDQLSRDFFGRVLHDSEYARLIGAPPGSTIEVTGVNKTFNIRTTHPLYDGPQLRFLDRDPVTDELVMHNYIFNLKPDAPEGFGLWVFANQVLALQKLNFDEIQTLGYRMDIFGYIGHYVWPRMGFNAKIPPEYSPLIQRDLGITPHDLHDLMSTKEGRDWWKNRGDSLELTFDLKSKSAALKKLAEYLEERQMVIPGADNLVKAEQGDSQHIGDHSVKLRDLNHPIARILRGF